MTAIPNSEAIPNDLYFENIRILPTAVNAAVCKSWYVNIIRILKKQKQSFYELQIYNLIINKYSDYPLRPLGGHTVRRKIDFTDKNATYEDNIFNIAYDNMIKHIFHYLKADTVVFLNIKESLIHYYTRYISIHKKYGENDYIDRDIAYEYKGILEKYYNHTMIDDDDDVV